MKNFKEFKAKTIEKSKKLIKSRDFGFDLWQSLGFLAFRGSIAHGTYQEGSIDDIDLIGYSHLPLDYSVGLNSFGSRDCGTVELQHGDLDIVIYSFKKYIALLLKQNPNVLSTLFLDSDYILIADRSYMELTACKHSFISAKSLQHFLGYAIGQEKRMERVQEYEGYMGSRRKTLVDQFGYDPKNAAHGVRILRMGIELLTTGSMDVYRKNDREQLMDIKFGKWELKDVKAEIKHLRNQLQNCELSESIIDQPQKKTANHLMKEYLHFYEDMMVF